MSGHSPESALVLGFAIVLSLAASNSADANDNCHRLEALSVQCRDTS
jgi:hypothetical protein